MKSEPLPIDAPGSDEQASWSSSRLGASRWLAFGVLLAFAVLYWNNAWISDDAQITFRSVEQLHAGHGPRWNPHERVQVFTHPLWFWALAAARVLTANLYYSALALSFLCCCVALALALRRVGSEAPRRIALVALLFASKSFVDYTSSGLENPLSLLLVLSFLLAYARDEMRAADPGALSRLTLVAALLGATRLDLLLLVAPALAGSALDTGKRSGWRPTLRALVSGSTPLLAWTLFATIYFGSPIPNTALAKLGTGIPTFILWDKGVDYIGYHLRYDPLSLFILAAGGVALWKARRGRALLAGCVFYLAYLVRIGGDFMSGRLLQPLVALAAVELVATSSLTAAKRLVAVAVGAALLVPGSPPFSDGIFPAAAKLEPRRGDVGNEKGNYFRGSSLRDPTQFDDLRPRANQPPLSVAQMIGHRGYSAPLDAIIVDEYALADPFLSRLPAKQDSRVGHFRRVLPAGYLESLATGENRIADPVLSRLYDRVVLVTRGPLWSAARWRAILALQFFPTDLSGARLTAYRLRVEETSGTRPLAPREATGRVERVRIHQGRVRFDGWLPPMLSEPEATLLVVAPVAPSEIVAESTFRHVDLAGAPLRADEERSGFQLTLTFPEETLARDARETCLFAYSRQRRVSPIERLDGGCERLSVPTDLLVDGNQ